MSDYENFISLKYREGTDLATNPEGTKVSPLGLKSGSNGLRNQKNVVLSSLKPKPGLLHWWWVDTGREFIDLLNCCLIQNSTTRYPSLPDLKDSPLFVYSIRCTSRPKNGCLLKTLTRSLPYIIRVVLLRSIDWRSGVAVDLKRPVPSLLFPRDYSSSKYLDVSSWVTQKPTYNSTRMCPILSYSGPFLGW